MAARTLPEYLAEQTVRNQQRAAVIQTVGYDAAGRAKYESLTFGQLQERCDRMAEGLYAAGIRPGMKVVLMVKPSLDLFVLTFALMRVGAVLVMIDPGMGLRNLGKCLAEVGPEAFIGESLAHFARILFRWSADTVRIRITRGTRWLWGGYNLRHVPSLPAEKKVGEFQVDPGALCAIMFTSGSTGIAKGVEFTNDILTAQVEIMREVYHYGPDDISLATFPLFALMDLAIGLTVIIPDMDATKPAQADPRKLIQAISDHQAANMFGSPALLDNLSRYAEKHAVKLTSLRRVLTAGAPVRPDILRRMKAILPDGVQVFTPYGATEALPICNIGSEEIIADTSRETEKGAGTCIGRINPRIAAEIIRISDDPIPEWSDDWRVPDGEIGELTVSGPVITRRYHGRPRETSLAKIMRPNGTIMHRMGDLARRDEQGRIWFCGRKSQRVIATDGLYFTIPCESVFNTHPMVFRSALVGLGPKGAQTPAICLELEREHAAADPGPLFAELAELGGTYPHTRAIKQFFIHPAFPVDIRHNAKINREELSLWAAKQAAARNS
jgi:acyl-CoA synthetase (AMP-forming)/AMP-acid ligase II